MDNDPFDLIATYCTIDRMVSINYVRINEESNGRRMEGDEFCRSIMHYMFEQF